MKSRFGTSIDTLSFALPALTFVLTLTARVWGISTRFWMLGDQIRDWDLAMGRFTDLPLVGPATHVGGYTIGPAFYWILWAIRLCVGPWFDNLPHAGGVGQAILQSAADALLLVAVWRRTGSVWIAVTTVVLLATASYDLALSALVWNPVVGSTLAKAATALVLLEWYRGSTARIALTAAVAWTAVHAYTGAIFVTVSVLTALLADPIARRDWPTLRRTAWTIALVVALLQVPYVAYQVSHQFRDSAMGAVSDSVGRVLSGQAGPQVGASAAGYAAAFRFIQVLPWSVPFLPWVLLVCGAIVAVRYRRDPLLLVMTILPQVLAVAGYALFLAGLDHYYYLSLMPAAVLTLVLGATAVGPPGLTRAIAVALCVAAFALVPARLRYAATVHKMPEYGALVAGSRTVAGRGQPMRAIQTEFKVPPTSDGEVIYRWLGGRIDRKAPWVAVITARGGVVYKEIGGF
jgi:hypothetical protein